MVLLPPLVILPVLVALLLYYGSSSYDRLLIHKIESDLIVAHQYFRSVISDLGHRVNNTAQSNRLALALASGERAELSNLLTDQLRQDGLDFLHFLDSQGRVVATAGSSRALGRSSGDWPVVTTALAGELSTAIDIYEARQLAAVSSELEARAHLALVPTPNAAPTDRGFETRGMVIHSAAPVYDRDGRLLGVLEAGTLLNGNLDFVDRINDIIYREGSLPLGSKGTATLFLEDVRIATNVRLFQGERALGTRVSQVVRDKVLGRGELWHDKAFVVTDWYVSGYEPIVDSRGARVGMLYVGFLEAPFAAAKRQALAVMVALFVVVTAAGSVLSLRWARRIFQPIERMDNAMSAVESGDDAARVGRVGSYDEIGRLAAHLDKLLDRLGERNRELQRWGEELDRKVAERTRELSEANEQLRAAQEKLVMSEKLAAIGQLTAGVAHEINNPVAVIQGNLDVVREILGPAGAPVKDEMRLIDEQVNRIRLIVTKLLQFARPADYAGYVETVDVNAAVADCLVLVRPQLRKGNVRVELDLAARQLVSINRNELQQVIINLAVNAIQAMESGGTLTFRSRDWGAEGVTLAVEDTGPGIRAEDLTRIFNPFYTTKKQQGTGLGLSISFALMERYGGAIEVASEPGHGAVFTVRLRSQPRYLEAEVPLPWAEAGG